MATCKDCLHYEPCYSGGLSVWHNIEQTEEDHCKHFKDKALNTEVIRCVGCDKTDGIPNHCGDVWCRMHRVWFNIDGFCSYGSRRENKYEQ